MMSRRRTEIPNPWFARSCKKTIADQFVTSPFADDRARDVTDVVLIEAQDRSITRIRQCLPGAGKPVSMEAAELDAFLKIHLSGSGRLKGPVPSVVRFEIVFIDGQEFGF